MKKLISLSLAVIMTVTAFLCLPFCAWADGSGSLGSMENPVLSDGAQEDSVPTVPDEKPDIELARQFRDALTAKDTIFSFAYPSEVLTEEEVENTVWNDCVDLFFYAMSDELSVSCVDGDYLYYQWSSVYGDYEYNYDSSCYDITLYVYYNSENSDEYEVSQVVNEFLAGIDRSAVSDYQLLKLFHDYILDNCEYNNFDTYRNHISAGVFVDGLAVCQGYALAFYRLCSEAGFDVRVIQSDPDEGCHGWNLVYIGDAYYYVDTTWDDQQLVNKYKFFLVDYTTLRSMDSSYSKEHKLYDELYDDDEYFNTVYAPYISTSVYDSSAPSIANCLIDVDYDNPTETTVTDAQGNALVIGEDYEIITDSADCAVKINGLGEYAGTQSVRKPSISNLEPNMEYTFREYAQDITAPAASLDGLAYGDDYIVTYPEFYGSDVYYDVIQGVGKYTGVIYAKYEIAAIDISTLTVSQSFTQTYYNGSKQQPEVYFTDAPTDMELNSDYYIEESAQIYPGVYTMTVCGQYDYYGEISLTYEILKAPIADRAVTLSSYSFVADGTAKEPVVTVQGLRNNVDYAVAYSDNTAPGVAEAVITAQKYYDGTQTVYYYILPKQTRAEITDVSASSVTLEWKSVDNISGYKVEMYDGGVWKELQNAGAYQTIAVIDGLSSYTSYRFRVTPYVISKGQTLYAASSNETATITDYVAPSVQEQPASSSSSSSSKTSSSKSASSASGTSSNQSQSAPSSSTASSSSSSKPKKTSVSKLTTSKKSITVKWKKVSGVTGYQVQYSTNSSFKNAKSATVKGASKTSKKISGLKKGKKYYVRVRAYKTVNGKKVYGSWSAKKSIKVK